MPPIVAIVVTYNRKDLLLECISHLEGQRIERGYGTGVPESLSSQLDILVIDNASTDGTYEVLLPLIEQGRIKYRNTGANLGGAGGFNFGMRVAVEEGYTYCWIMDDDCMPTPGALQGFIDADYGLQGQYGFLSSVVRWVDGSPCNINIQRHPLFSDITDFSLDLQPCTLASFVSLFLPCKVIERVGLPIKDFFIWTDDWEFTRRISRIYDCFVVGNSVVVHASRTNSRGTIVDNEPERLDRYRLIYRNDVVLYRREGFMGYAFLIARALKHMGAVLLHSPSAKLEKLDIIIRSNIEGMRFHPQIEYPARPSADAAASPDKASECPASPGGPSKAS